MTATTESAALDDRERQLREADVERVVVATVGGAHPDKCFVTLVTGDQLLCKPSAPDAERHARNEVAAYRLLRDMRWDDLIGITVWREIDVPNRGPTLSACQHLWENLEDSTVVEQLQDVDTTRAAVFDYLIGQTDRGGHNWLSVVEGGGRRLKLYDHAYAFEAQPGNASSSFVGKHQGAALTAEVRRGLERLIDCNVSDLTREMLPADVADRLVARARSLLDGGLFPTP